MPIYILWLAHDHQRFRDDADEAGQGRAEVTDRQPPASYDEPQHIAHQPQGARAEIMATVQFTSVYGFLTERPEREIANHKTGTRPGQRPKFCAPIAARMLLALVI